MKSLLMVCLFWTLGWSRACAQDSVAVPFQLTGNHIFISLLINGKGPFPAAFDTGSSVSLMTPDVAKEINLTPHGALRADGFGGKSLKAGLVEAKSVQIGGLTLPRPTFAVVDMGELPIKTVIGADVLRRFVVKIDYDAHVLTLTRPDTFVYRGSGIVLPLRRHGDIPAVDGAVDGIGGLFTLDTGAGGALVLFGPFVRAHDLRRRYAAGFTTAMGVGLGGIMQAQTVRVGTLMLGAASLRHVETALSADADGVAAKTGIAGNIGETLLRQFNLIFDDAHGQVILEKNKGYGRAEDGHAGIVLEPQGRAWRVIGVTPDEAAAQAGIREGDRVLQIEGKDAGQLSLIPLWDVFHRPVGTKVWVLLQAGEGKRLVALTLGKAP
jgi:predicted aspartyl protease